MRAVRIGGALVALIVFSASPALAQDREPRWWERLFAADVRQPMCEAGLDVISSALPGILSGAITVLARASGVCPTENPGPQPVPPPNPGTGTSTAGPSVASPGLQVRVLSIKGTTTEPILATGTPQTVYSQGEGFALIVATNSPGYLEVWSLDDTNQDRFIEGIVLDPRNGSVVSLPKVVEGAYRFTDAGGRDNLRIRFFPCRHLQPQSFEAVANERVARSVQTLTPELVTMQGQLPTCTFPATVDRTAPRDELFRRSQEVRASYSTESGLYTAVFDRAAAPSATSLAIDIEFKRQ